MTQALAYHGSTLPLEWSALCRFVAHRRLPAWRGDLPLKSPDHLPLDAPASIAVCAQFSMRHRFATEAEAETFRWVGAHAQDAVIAWSAAKYSREDCRISLESLRHWLGRVGEPYNPSVLGNVKRDIAEFRARWKLYRRDMRAAGMLAGWVRSALTPRQPEPLPTLQAA